MRQTRNLLIVLAVTAAISGCTSSLGEFCDSYTQVGMTRAGAVAIVTADRRAAERIEVNESLYDRCR